MLFTIPWCDDCNEWNKGKSETVRDDNKYNKESCQTSFAAVTRNLAMTKFDFCCGI